MTLCWQCRRGSRTGIQEKFHAPPTANVRLKVVRREGQSRQGGLLHGGVFVFMQHGALVVANTQTSNPWSILTLVVHFRVRAFAK